MGDKYLSYVCQECGGAPKPGIFYSSPSDLSGRRFNKERVHLIETSEGHLMGICSKTEKLCKFDIIEK